MMWIDHTPLLCDFCHHEWEGEILQSVAVTAWVAHVKSIHCPKCGANWKRIRFKAYGTQEAAKHAGEI